MKNLFIYSMLIADLLCSNSFAADEVSKGQTLYLPVYSHIWHGDRVVDGRSPLKSQVSALVSIRNTSMKSPIRVLSASYYNTEGRLLQEFVKKPVTINAMGTFELFVESKDSEGGSGANFIIKWDAANPTNPPLVEAVHAEIKGHKTFTFITSARPIQVDK